MRHYLGKIFDNFLLIDISVMTQEGIHTNHTIFSIFHIPSAILDDLRSIYKSQNNTVRITTDAIKIPTYIQILRTLLSFAFSKRLTSRCILWGTM